MTIKLRIAVTVACIAVVGLPLVFLKVPKPESAAKIKSRSVSKPKSGDTCTIHIQGERAIHIPIGTAIEAEDIGDYRCEEAGFQKVVTP
jgi:hypothetical protein